MITLQMMKPLGGLLKRIGIKAVMDDIMDIDLKEEDATDRIGRVMIGSILEHLEEASDDLVLLCAAYKDITPEEAMKIDVIATLKDMFAESGFAGFFKDAVARASRGSSNS